MEKNETIVKKENNDQIVVPGNKNTLTLQVATELAKTYEDIKDVIDLLKKDTRVEDLVDEDDKKIGQRTHVHPQLIKWNQEARHTLESVWKLGGGELAQAAEKKIIEIKANLIMNLLNKSKKDREELLKQWKKSVSFKK